MAFTEFDLFSDLAPTIWTATSLLITTSNSNMKTYILTQPIHNYHCCHLAISCNCSVSFSNACNYHMQVKLFFSAVCDFFVCESNISKTTKRICAKFTGKTCLVPRSDEFECQGQRSRLPGTKNALCTRIAPGSDGMERARCKQRQGAANGTIPSLPRG